MSSNRTLNALGAGCGRSVLVYILSAAIAVPLICLCVFAPLGLAFNLEPNDPLFYPLLLIPLVCFPLTLFGGGGALLAWVFISRARKLDAVFAPLGMTGKGFSLSGRQYHGAFGGRQVDVYFHPGQGRGMFRGGAKLDIYLSAPFKTRLGIGLADSVGDALAGMINRQPMQTGDPALNQLRLYPHDEPWSRALLADESAKAALLRLAAPIGGLEMRNILIEPEALHLQCYRLPLEGITPENIRQWLNDMFAMVRAAETLPPPAQQEEASALERNLRVDRGRLSSRVILITFAVFGALIACSFVAGGAFFLWAVMSQR